MSSKTDICNLALSHVASGSGISNFDTDQSEPARACRLFYEIARTTALRDFDWPFATKFKALSLIEEDATEDLGNEWEYSYAYPSDCIRFRRILSGARTDSNATKIKFRIASAGSAKVIYTDETAPIAEITEDITETGRFDADFVIALSCRLAAMIAPRISAGDKNQLGPKAMAMYEAYVRQARANAITEDQSTDESNGDLYDAR